MISRKYEKIEKYLELYGIEHRGLDDDGLVVTCEAWACCIFDKGATDEEEGRFIEFISETLAMMFITQNNWKELWGEV